MTWDDREYLEYLAGERLRYAWTMRHYGGLAEAEAQAAALEHYPYEPPDATDRELVFHDEAWHWAMLRIHGSQYWQRHPELLKPPAGYEALG